MSYQPTNPEVWSGRKDPSGALNTYYWHQIINCVSLEDLSERDRGAIVFLGYKSDEGVRRNQGRVGARKGPDSIRSAMSKFALHFDPDQYPLFDAGNVITSSENLEGSQAELAHKVDLLLAKGYRPILLGGGHEISYGHYSGIRRHVRGQAIGIVNLDAHFDLRPYPNGPHSGSPFRQILDDCRSAGHEFHYLPIGISPAGNQKVLFETQLESGQTYILESAVNRDLDSALTQVKSFAEKVDHLYLTLDLDVIPSAFAPGVSAPAAFGLEPNIIRKLIQTVFATGKVISFDIAELNPTYDDGRTAKLAALFIYEVVMGQINQ